MPLPSVIAWYDIIVQTKRRLCTSRCYISLSTIPTSQTVLDEIAADLSSQLAPKIKAILSSDCQYAGIVLHSKNGTAELISESGEGADSGDGDAISLPDEVAAEIQKRTGQVGRSKRGRLFFSGLPNTSNDDGVLTADAKTTLGLLAAFIGADITASGTVLHPRHYNRLANTLDIITRCRPVSVFASRRDRRHPLALNPF